MFWVNNNGGLKLNNMSIALVCIAKNEDNYIDEWINYHLKLGFDDIFIYQNDWRYQNNHDRVKKYVIDGINRQRDAYNHFVKTHGKEFEWTAFFDVDEFLVLKKHKNMKDFLGEYSDLNALGVNWVLFGDNGHQKIDGEYSVIKRFTKRQNQVNHHVKCIVKTGQNFIMDVHNPNTKWFNLDGQPRSGPFNYNGKDDIAQINHYFSKTKEEFILKCERGRADSPVFKRTIVEHESHNFNEIEDLTAYNFMYNDNNNLLNT